MRNVRQRPSVESLAREVGNILWHGQPTGITDPAQLQRLRADRTGYPDSREVRIKKSVRGAVTTLWHGQPTGITDPAQLQRLRADRTGYPDRPTFSEYMQSVAWLIWNGSV